MLSRGSRNRSGWVITAQPSSLSKRHKGKQPLPRGGVERAAVFAAFERLRILDAAAAVGAVLSIVTASGADRRLVLPDASCAVAVTL